MGKLPVENKQNTLQVSSQIWNNPTSIYFYRSDNRLKYLFPFSLYTWYGEDRGKVEQIKKCSLILKALNYT